MKNIKNIYIYMDGFDVFRDHVCFCGLATIIKVVIIVVEICQKRV